MTCAVHASGHETGGDRPALRPAARFLSGSALEVGDGDDVEQARNQGAGGAATGISSVGYGKGHALDARNNPRADFCWHSVSSRSSTADLIVLVPASIITLKNGRCCGMKSEDTTQRGAVAVDADRGLTSCS